MKSVPVKSKEMVYDQMILATMQNIITLSPKKEIIIQDLEIAISKGHRTFLTIASYASSVTGKSLCIKTSLFKYLQIKFMFKHMDLKWRPFAKENIIHPEKEILHIICSYNEEVDAFDKIWEKYYEFRKEELNAD
jgi:hypothetical protein